MISISRSGDILGISRRLGGTGGNFDGRGSGWMRTGSWTDSFLEMGAPFQVEMGRVLCAELSVAESDHPRTQCCSETKLYRRSTSCLRFERLTMLLVYRNSNAP